MSRLADIVAEFVVALDDAGVTVAIGRKNLHRNDLAPRIVFVPMGGPIEMTREIGRQDISASEATRALYQRNLTCEVHLWGKSDAAYTATEQLLHDTVNAMRLAALGSYQVGEESWPSDDEQHAGDDNYGEHAMLTVTLEIPICEVESALTAGAVTMDHQCIFALANQQYGNPQLTYGYSGLKYGGNPEVVD